jgi:hypothetical protein
VSPRRRASANPARPTPTSFGVARRGTTLYQLEFFARTGLRGRYQVVSLTPDRSARAIPSGGRAYRPRVCGRWSRSRRP